LKVFEHPAPLSILQRLLTIVVIVLSLRILILSKDIVSPLGWDLENWQES